MTGSIIFSIFSFVGMIVVLLSNIFHKETPKFIRKSDEAIVRWFDEGKRLIRVLDKRTIGVLLHYVIEETEAFFIKVFGKLKELVKK